MTLEICMKFIINTFAGIFVILLLAIIIRIFSIALEYHRLTGIYLANEPEPIADNMQIIVKGYNEVFTKKFAMEPNYTNPSIYNYMLISNQSSLINAMNALHNDGVIRIMNTDRDDGVYKLDEIIGLFNRFFGILHINKYEYWSKLNQLQTELVMDLFNIVQTNDTNQRYILINIIEREYIRTILFEYEYNMSFEYKSYYITYRLR